MGRPLRRNSNDKNEIDSQQDNPFPSSSKYRYLFRSGTNNCREKKILTSSSLEVLSITETVLLTAGAEKL
jgi:hypothetical protein